MDDTLNHIRQVQTFLQQVISLLLTRAFDHDRSKLSPEEKHVFDQTTPLLKSLTYGSEEYKEACRKLGDPLRHHYEHNSHHPDHFSNGINGMTLLDVVEMFCDWKAATMRHADGNFKDSIQINRERFKIADQLVEIFENTRKELGW